MLSETRRELLGAVVLLAVSWMIAQLLDAEALAQSRAAQGDLKRAQPRLSLRGATVPVSGVLGLDDMWLCHVVAIHEPVDRHVY